MTARLLNPATTLLQKVVELGGDDEGEIRRRGESTKGLLFTIRPQPVRLDGCAPGRVHDRPARIEEGGGLHSRTSGEVLQHGREHRRAFGRQGQAGESGKTSSTQIFVDENAHAALNGSRYALGGDAKSRVRSCCDGRR